MVDGRSLGDLPNMIHKTHLGHHLARQGYDYAGVLFNHVGYPQDSRNCQNCHSTRRERGDAAGRQLEGRAEPAGLRRLP